MPQYNIYHFSNYILRNPVFPIATYLNLLEDYSEKKLLNLYHDDYIKAAIKIASPDLKTALDNWSNNPTSLSDEKKSSLIISFLKYLARICSRCTPFGLFAGCDVGDISVETKIILKDKQSFTRVTQFDMHFWTAMLQDFAKRDGVIEYLTYYPNNSIYSLGDFYRYIEYKYVDKKREHRISAFRKTEMLTDLLRKAENGITLAEMISFLSIDETQREAAQDYVYKLIDSQLLVCELDAQITGEDEWERVFAILNKIPVLKREQDILLKCKEQIDLLDKTIITNDSIYDKIEQLLGELKCDYVDKFLFQTDLNISTISNSIDKKIIDKTKQALYFLNGIQEKQSDELTNFITSFLERYETREMPIATVLDTETGIGYLQNTKLNDIHPLLDTFSFNKNNNYKDPYNWTENEFILEKKLHEAISNNVTEIVLTEKDFPNFNSDWNNSPATLSVMIEVVKHQDAEQVIIDSMGGRKSAAKLLGRFCNVNQDIHTFTKEIIEKEQNYFDDKILAEIAHVPQSRTGNILRKPVLRTYEIPYLTNSGVAKKHQIPISDLMISIKRNTVVLRSKRLNKEIVPCLSNAHNYRVNGLPIYHFLCDLQSQHMKLINKFDWGVLQEHYDYFPRVLYKDVILAKAKWQINNNEIAFFYSLKGNTLMENFKPWKDQRKLPRYVNWVKSDNTLLLDLEKEIGVKLFLESVKNLETIVLEEFLFSDEGIVKDANGSRYTNQVILSFYKEKMN